MNLLDLEAGGIAIMTTLVIWGVAYMLRESHKDWREWRDLKKKLDDAKALHAKYRWGPDMQTGRNRGEWVRKNGPPYY